MKNFLEYYHPILQIFENEVTYLSLRDDETLRYELIVTTPGHPFYLEKNVDGSTRPAPKGHEDLSEPWVGAGDLKLGDKVRQADGTAGTVRIVKTTQQERTMYNLDIANLDNFYVGEQGWLVHNANCKLGFFDQESLSRHFGSHGNGVGAKNAPEYLESAQLTVDSGIRFNYYDFDGSYRTGFYNPKTDLFTGATEDMTRITTHYRPSGGPNYVLNNLDGSTLKQWQIDQWFEDQLFGGH